MKERLPRKMKKAYDAIAKHAPKTKWQRRVFAGIVPIIRMLHGRPYNTGEVVFSEGQKSELLNILTNNK